MEISGRNTQLHVHTYFGFQKKKNPGTWVHVNWNNSIYCKYCKALPVSHLLCFATTGTNDDMLVMAVWKNKYYIICCDVFLSSVLSFNKQKKELLLPVNMQRSIYLVRLVEQEQFHLLASDIAMDTWQLHRKSERRSLVDLPVSEMEVKARTVEFLRWVQNTPNHSDRSWPVLKCP